MNARNVCAAVVSSFLHASINCFRRRSSTLIRKPQSSAITSSWIHAVNT